MPGENSQSNTTQTSANSEANSNNSSTTQNKEGSQSQANEGAEKTIPYSRFAEVNSKFKETREKLAGYEAKEKTAAEQKLLDEKNYQELIGNKNKEIETLKMENGQIKKTVKEESLKNKISNALAKNNIIDAEDGLKFVKYDDLLDSDAADGEIEKRVTDLVKSKAYLFNAGKSGSQRSNSENNVPGNQQKPLEGTQKGKSAHQTIEQSLAEKLKF